MCAATYTATHRSSNVLLQHIAAAHCCNTFNLYAHARKEYPNNTQRIKKAARHHARIQRGQIRYGTFFWKSLSTNQPATLGLIRRKRRQRYDMRPQRFQVLSFPTPYIYTCTCIYTYNVCLYIYNIYICIYIYIYMCMHVYTYIYIDIFV